jgi:hypothetical protein
MLGTHDFQPSGLLVDAAHVYDLVQPLCAMVNVVARHRLSSAAGRIARRRSARQIMRSMCSTRVA